MDSCEGRVTALLASPTQAREGLSSLAHELGADSRWSEVTTQLEPIEWNRGRSDAQLGYWGYVDGELGGFGGVVWTVELIRTREGGWTVEREVSVNVTDAQDTHRAFADVHLADSAALVDALPSLVRELVAVPPPTVT
jgi:hypothetical protein